MNCNSHDKAIFNKIANHVLFDNSNINDISKINNEKDINEVLDMNNLRYLSTKSESMKKAKERYWNVVFKKDDQYKSCLKTKDSNDSIENNILNLLETDTKDYKNELNKNKKGYCNKECESKVLLFINKINKKIKESNKNRNNDSINQSTVDYKNI